MTLDKILKTLRLSKNLTVKELSDILFINVDKIKILESQDFATILSKRDLYKFLRRYCKFFDLSFSKLKKYSYINNNVFYKNRLFVKKIGQNISFFGFVKIFAVFSIILLLFFYVGIEIKNRYSKPDLFVDSPSDNYSTNNKEVAVSGKTVSNVIVKINGETILTNNDGSFRKDILLNDGLNVIKISAYKKGGYENIITKRIILEKNSVAKTKNIINLE